jgi:hypothetical protein
MAAALPPRVSGEELFLILATEVAQRLEIETRINFAETTFPCKYDQRWKPPSENISVYVLLQHNSV